MTSKSRALAGLLTIKGANQTSQKPRIQMRLNLPFYPGYHTLRGSSEARR